MPATMRAVTVTIRTVRQDAVILKSRHAPPQIRVHGVRVARVQPGVRHAHRHARPPKPSCCVTVGVPTLPSSPPTIFDAASSTSLRLGAGSIQSTALDCASAGKFARSNLPRKTAPRRKSLSCWTDESSDLHTGDFRRRRPRRNQNITRRQSAPDYSATRRPRRRTTGIQSCNPVDKSPSSGRSPAL